MSYVASTFYAFLSSKFRRAGQTPCDYTLNLPDDTIRTRERDQVIRVTLENFTCLNELPAVSASLGNHQVRVGPTVYTMEDGNYRVTDLVAWVNALPGLSVSYDSVRNKFRFVGTSPAPQLVTFLGAAGTLFGFSEGHAMTIPDGSTVMSTNYIKVRTSNEIVVHLINLQSGPVINVQSVQSSFRPANMLAVIPVSTFPGGYLSYDNVMGSFAMETLDETVSELAFRFTDTQGNLLTMLPEHTMTLKIEILQKPSRRIEQKMEELTTLVRTLILTKAIKYDGDPAA